MRRIANRSVAAILVVLLALLVAQAGFAEGKKVNINTATATELATLKGIGAAKSQAIVDYREKHGTFKTVDDLKAVRGIGDKVLESLRPHITVGIVKTGRTTAQR